MYNESENADFLIRLREIIKSTKEVECGFEKYMKYVEEKRNNK